MIDLKTIKNAHNRIKNIVHNTPFAYAPILSNMSGYDVYLKKENLQITGAFKLRGAFNKIASLVEDGKSGGVVAASAGNHAQGVAYSAKHFNLKATIVMPESTPLTKVQGGKDLGASVILKGSNYDEAYEYATTYAKEHS
jgi:threonine dehydratase